MLGSPTVPPVLSTKTPRLPYKASYIVPLIAKTIAETPMTSNKVLCQILKPWGKPYCFTEAIIQGARTEARKLIFGNADDNVCYAKFVKEDLEKAGHHVSLSFTTRKETMQNLDKIIIAEEAQRRKGANIAGILPGQRKDFVLQWKNPYALNTAHTECITHRTQQQRDTSPVVHIVQEQCPGSALSVPSFKRAVPPEGAHALCACMITHSASRLRMRTPVHPPPQPPKLPGRR